MLSVVLLFLLLLVLILLSIRVGGVRVRGTALAAVSREAAFPLPALRGRGGINNAM